jgi:TonB family protein
MAKKQYTDAEKLYERLLLIYEKVFGKDHINNAIIVERLALLSYLRGNFKNAEAFYSRSLATKEHALGAEHADVAPAALDLAEFYRSRGDYKKAEPLFLRALEINDKTLPRDNPAATNAIQRYQCFVYESKGMDEAQKRMSAFWEARKAKFPEPPASPNSGGVLNGKAISLPAPSYPSEARAIRASGVVIVQVTIGNNGAVVDAKLICGNPVFSKACLEAAQRARFTPTKLSGQPVQVNGLIIYNFVLNN